MKRTIGDVAMDVTTPIATWLMFCVWALKVGATSWSSYAHFFTHWAWSAMSIFFLLAISLRFVEKYEAFIHAWLFLPVFSATWGVSLGVTVVLTLNPDLVTKYNPDYTGIVLLAHQILHVFNVLWMLVYITARRDEIRAMVAPFKIHWAVADIGLSGILPLAYVLICPPASEVYGLDPALDVLGSIWLVLLCIGVGSITWHFVMHKGRESKWWRTTVS